MAFSTRAPGRRRLASLLLSAAAIASIVTTPAVRASYAVDDATLTAQEAAMVAALNQDRADAGLIAVRTDPRLMAIARARSDDMIAKGYFSHTQPDGRNVFDILTAQGITWYNAGEIIAWNNYPIDVTASTANRQWMNSPGHHAIIVSTDLNYVGVGLAVDPNTGKKMWTAVYIKGPDRTPARAAWATSALGAGPTSTTRRVSLSWTGSDPRLQVLTAGLKGFTLQRRVDGGAWTTIWSGTLATSGSLTVTVGHRYDVRVAAVDKKGNWSPWRTVGIDLVRGGRLITPRP